MKKVATVVVCTYNRAHLLRSCLESLLAQTLDQGQFEVLVVDNNSTDATSQIVNEYTAKYSHFVAVAERQQGLSYARNRGWKEADGESSPILMMTPKLTPTGSRR